MNRPFDVVTSIDAIASQRAPTLYFHADVNLLPAALAGKLNFINILTGILTDWGYQVGLVAAGNDIDAIAQSVLSHLHIVMGYQPIFGANLLASIPGYLHGFWYLDEMGVRNNSSIRMKDFSPKGMDSQFAQQVFAKLRDKFVDGNLSKYPQANSPGFQTEKGAISLFLQDFKPSRHYPNYVSFPDLITRVIAHRGNRHVYIKPHPLQRAEDFALIMPHHDPNGGVSVVDHGIHQLLAASGLVVTQTSAVGFEAYLHKVPVVLAGQTDFHHNAVTVRDGASVSAAMDTALAQRFHFEKYLVWFLKQNMLEPLQRKRTIERCKAILTNKGFGPL